MASLTKAEMRDRVLENLGVKPAGQSASSEDANVTEEVIDSVHRRLREEELAPFLTSAIPDWAQVPLRDLVSFDLLNTFGVGEVRASRITNSAITARRELAKYTSVGKPQEPVYVDYF